MTSKIKIMQDKKGKIDFDFIIVILIGVFIIGILIYGWYSISSISENQEEFYEKYYDFKINSFKAMRDSCIQICEDEDLFWSSAEFGTVRCFCSDSDGKIIQYRLEINDEIWNKYFPKKLN